MTFYLLFLIVLLLASFLISNIRMRVLWGIALMFVLSVSVGLRYDVGTDYFNYYYTYKEITTFSDVLSSRVEFGFSFLCYIFNSIGFAEPYLFFFFISFLTNFFLYKAISKLGFRKYILEILFLYFCFFFLNFQYNTVRHGLMVSIVWYAFSFIEKRHFYKFLFSIILAGMFHKMAFFFLPFYWLLNLKHKRFFLYLIFIAFVLYIIGFKFLTTIAPFVVGYIPSIEIQNAINFYLYDYYFNKESSSGLSLGFVIYLLLYFIIYFNKDKFSHLRNFNLFLNALFFALFFFLLFNDVGVFVQRISSVFYISLLFLTIIIANNFFRNKKNLALIYIVFLLYGLLLFKTNISMKSSENNYQFLPYKTIFNKNIQL